MNARFINPNVSSSVKSDVSCPSRFINNPDVSCQNGFMYGPESLKLMEMVYNNSISVKSFSTKVNSFHYSYSFFLKKYIVVAHDDIAYKSFHAFI